MGKKHTNKTPKESVVESVTEQAAVVEDEIEVEAEAVEAEVQETVEEPKEVEPVIGIVSGCEKLNIRKTPTPGGKVLCVVDKDSELVIDLDKSKETWYSVCTSAGIEGFCMKQFVTIK